MIFKNIYFLKMLTVKMFGDIFVKVFKFLSILYGFRNFGDP